MDSTIQIFRPVAPTLDEGTGIVTAVSEGDPVYSGKARIYSVEGAGVVSVGEADYSTRVTYVSIPVDTFPVPHNDDIVVVTASPSDPDLAGRAMRVIEVEGGGLMRPVRRMRVSSFIENRSWDG